MRPGISFAQAGAGSSEAGGRGACPRRAEALCNRAFALVGIIAVMILPARVGHAQLPGFTLDGDSWTYAVPGQTTISGHLRKPPGDGPFPAVIISHGKSLNGLGFTSSKAQEMVQWGLVCIGPLYTHGVSGSDPSLDGARAENMRRAYACIEILKSLNNVDPQRIAAYGNSMGAFVSVQLSADKVDDILVTAITAGGVAVSGDGPAPNIAEAGPVRAPFLILHGTADGTVPPAQSEYLKNVLDGNGVPNERVLYDGIGHNLHQDEAADVYARIQNWFTAWGHFTPISTAEMRVRFGYEGAQRGTSTHPFATLAAALPAVQVSGALKIHAGATGETPAIDKAVRLEAFDGPVRIGESPAPLALQEIMDEETRVGDWREF